MNESDLTHLGKELLDSDPERGVALLGLDGRVLYSNTAARTYLRDGTTRGRDGLLPASLDGWLVQFIERIQSHRGPLSTEVHYPSAEDRRLRVTFETRYEGERPHIVLRAYPATPWLEPSVRRLQARFGLTLREAQVAAGVSRGHTNREVAAKLGIVEKTVKNVLMAVFTKCSVRNRVELALRAYDAPVGTLQPHV
ncbi:MAG: helix-turn-helix transcriptional regulator [Planctomycetota bacterium]|nr:helix-turn-helix transcriptional regulator [Planctomycetota bacterium]